MKLQENQLRLIRHLAQYEVMDYLDCLAALDESGGKDRKTLSYLFRPLTKNGYLSKRKNGSVVILAKGRVLFPKIKSLVATGGGAAGLARNCSVSCIAWLLQSAGVESSAQMKQSEQPYFIPSACWRKIRLGILSTTRFAGMLMLDTQRIVVYDIGDGNMDWQMKAERSLFYRNYGEHETKATGILLVCKDGCGESVSQRIIRQTMWRRKQLIHTQSGYEREKPVQYVRAPVRLSWYFEHAYFCEHKDLALRLEQIRHAETITTHLRQENPSCYAPKDGDFERWPERVFVNYACDLLKFVYFFSAMQSLRHARETLSVPTELQYTIVCHKTDYPILRMYPDLLDEKGLNIGVFTDQ